MKNYLLNNVFEIPEFKFDIKKLKHTYLNNKNIWATYGKGEKDTILPRKNSLHTKYVEKEDVIEHISQIKNYENILYYWGKFAIHYQLKLQIYPSH